MKRTTAGAVALIAIGASGVAGDDVFVPRRAKLEFRVLGTAPGSPTRPMGGYFSPALDERASMAENMQVRLLPIPDSPCRAGIRIGPTDAAEGSLPLWQVEGVVQHAGMDKITVEYAWKRRLQPGRSSIADAEGRGEATLWEGERVMLDFVPALDASEGCYQNVALELAASIPEDPAFEDRRIGYDLWLVREHDGKRFSRRLQLIGKQGQSVEFDYGMFRSRLGEASDNLEMTISGSVRSRIQPDGSVELRLAAHRTARPSNGHWATAASGEKRVRAALGETLRLEIPPPTSANLPELNEPETFRAIADQHVALVLTPTLVE